MYPCPCVGFRGIQKGQKRFLILIYPDTLFHFFPKLLTWRLPRRWWMTVFYPQKGLRKETLWFLDKQQNFHGTTKMPKSASCFDFFDIRTEILLKLSVLIRPTRCQSTVFSLVANFWKSLVAFPINDSYASSVESTQCDCSFCCSIDWAIFANCLIVKSQKLSLLLPNSCIHRTVLIWI